jgi:hypothetical protein
MKVLKDAVAERGIPMKKFVSVVKAELEAIVWMMPFDRRS